ncbi:MAG TPA: DNA alkylation repair protein [Candidatus Mediterraneibacter stercoripullorum]|nr:DNA alkylation repair protein [Candidatus Mediterraneibacter stercoripullorum]
MVQEIREQLFQLSEESYKDFNRNIVPGEERMIGVRLPALRKLARETAKSSGREYLDEAAEAMGPDSLHEEIMLYGMVLGYTKMEKEERAERLDRFVPLIRTWAICDTCVTGYKFMEKEPDYWFDYLKRYETSDKEFDLRFMIISMLSHFIDDRHIDEVLRLCGSIRNDGYYTKMGVAWTVSVCYVKYPEKTRKLLESGVMDEFTHNKSIQKIRESYRVSREEKEELKKLKKG